ncbi:hypothetical protein HOLleu_39573 [Holothuria leucospilota]|uniref:Transmembrane protein n=1 Tax=Holothuria leucospilota TaxID=206669 RepID=A0A9Q1BC10_HOLLE|nr:hypothetical protein HOLleu_39573 [Holothuria leucospilota]
MNKSHVWIFPHFSPTLFIFSVALLCTGSLEINQKLSEASKIDPLYNDPYSHGHRRQVLGVQTSPPPPPRRIRAKNVLSSGKI